MAGGFWSNLGNKALTNFTGRTETALLEIEDVSEKMEEEPIPVSDLFNEDSASRLLQAAGSVLGEAVPPAVNPKNNKIVLRVQFNPSELTINAFNPSFVTRQDMTGGNNTQGQNNTNPTNTLTVQLYYDDMRVPDAFMQEKFDLSAIGLAKSAATAVSDAINKRETHSVQPQVEGLMSLLNNRGTRMLTFRWNDFEFRGILELVQAQYTMFNTVGAPVRAKVLLQISRAFTHQERVQWRKDLMLAFHDNRLDASRFQDKAGALLNLNL